MFEIVYLIGCSLVMGTCSAFMILLLDKWNTLSWYEMNREKWMPKRCEFCLGFWLSAIQLLIYQNTLTSEPFRIIILISIPMASVLNMIFLNKVYGR